MTVFAARQGAFIARQEIDLSDGFLRLFRLFHDPAMMDPEAFVKLIAHEKLATRYKEHRRRWGIDKKLLERIAKARRTPPPIRRWAKAELNPPRHVPTQVFMRDANGDGRVYSREDLYELVWSEPILTLAARFGISDNGLRKRCRAMAVPTPPPGYWQKVKQGRKVRKRPLPSTREG